MQTGNKNRKDERRSGIDRRLQAIGLDFPFVDSHGNLVTEERRQTDRRNPEKLNRRPETSKHKNFA